MVNAQRIAQRASQDNILKIQSTQIVIGGASLYFPCVVSGFENAANGLSQGAVEGAQATERHVNKPMLAGSFHQLGNAPTVIDVHDHK